MLLAIAYSSTGGRDGIHDSPEM
jgi:hypothetical protein